MFKGFISHLGKNSTLMQTHNKLFIPLQLRGAPYKVNVIGASYPNRVVVNGEGLRGGLYGQNLDFRIDTRKAGAGERVFQNMNFEM